MNDATFKLDFLKMMALFKKKWSITCILFVSLSFMIGFPTENFAQDTDNDTIITPSHVYQKTEILRLELESLGLIDMQLYEKTSSDLKLRHPRHVMQKVRECHQIISKIMVAKNIMPEPFPALFSVREIRPSDVRKGVDHLLEEVGKFGDTLTKQPPFVAGKLPDDVFNNLKRTCQSINVNITSSNVYQVASVILENMIKISKFQEYEFNIPQMAAEQKKSADVYQKTLMFLVDLQVLALNPDYAIPGGVIISHMPIEHEITPNDVIGLMNDALSETSAIKYTLGIREEISIAPYQPGHTPSDVFYNIHNAHLILKEIIRKEAELDNEVDE